jgi:hypothetical protein
MCLLTSACLSFAIAAWRRAGPGRATNLTVTRLFRESDSAEEGFICDQKHASVCKLTSGAPMLGMQDYGGAGHGIIGASGAEGAMAYAGGAVIICCNG